MRYDKIEGNAAEYINLVPRNSTGVPNNSIFTDTSDNVLKLRDNSGAIKGLSGYSGPTGNSGYSGLGTSGYSGPTGSSGYSGGGGAYDSNRQLFSSSGTYTTPSGVSIIYVSMVGGGAGGGTGVTTYGGGGGGGAGAYCTKSYLKVTPSTGYTVTIGAGGAGSTNPPYNGASGGSTYIVGDDMTLTAMGATGGEEANGSPARAGGAGGAVSLGSYVGNTGSGGWTAVETGVQIFAGYSGGSGEGGNPAAGGGGGGSPLGRGGKGGNADAVGMDGRGYGAGGGGGGSGGNNRTGGAGKDGCVLVEW